MCDKAETVICYLRKGNTHVIPLPRDGDKRCQTDRNDWLARRDLEKRKRASRVTSKTSAILVRRDRLTFQLLIPRVPTVFDFPALRNSLVLISIR
jgi:hypothetical protein